MFIYILFMKLFYLHIYALIVSHWNCAFTLFLWKNVIEHFNCIAHIDREIICEIGEIISLISHVISLSMCAIWPSFFLLRCVYREINLIITLIISCHSYLSITPLFLIHYDVSPVSYLHNIASTCLHVNRTSCQILLDNALVCMFFTVLVLSVLRYEATFKFLKRRHINAGRTKNGELYIVFCLQIVLFLSQDRSTSSSSSSSFSASLSLSLSLTRTVLRSIQYRSIPATDLAGAAARKAVNIPPLHSLHSLHRLTEVSVDKPLCSWLGIARKCIVRICAGERQREREQRFFF